MTIIAGYPNKSHMLLIIICRHIAKINGWFGVMAGARLGVSIISLRTLLSTQVNGSATYNSALSKISESYSCVIVRA